ncbi:hypothetical protein CAPTEDRAFT_4404 [Capitella teleta]|uniref:Neurotransmitter-gated ion-channel ligand-binding domain-containing protein n=1 Tax=Capitella teleta TaxID=283909 RepID=R7TCU7_CAPTE|nr:hypothetical protein CAPTEDRAFT_4404 [Capitella teleta]|eukprot:ELT91578.1 hypothetical protein CAPTEDRAFT_4404 [Capitella teleta]
MQRKIFQNQYLMTLNNYTDGPPTTVDITIFINFFGKLDEINMEYHMDIFLRQMWYDDRMRYRGATGPITFVGSTIDAIWKPDTFFPNAKHAEIHGGLSPNRLLKGFPNGTVLYTVRLSMALQCEMNLAAYPMDTQTCDLTLSSFSYDESDVTLEWSKVNAVVLSRNMSLPQFTLQNYGTDKCVDNHLIGEFSCMRVTFNLRRTFGYYLLQIYMPTAFVVILSWVSFWINKDAVPARISLGVTTVLTMTTQLSSSTANAPKVSYAKALDIWMTTCMAFVFAAIIHYAFVNALSRRKPTPPAQQNNDAVEVNDDLTKKLDRIARYIFPASFLVFNIGYWATYMPY